MINSTERLVEIVNLDRLHARLDCCKPGSSQYKNVHTMIKATMASVAALTPPCADGDDNKNTSRLIGMDRQIKHIRRKQAVLSNLQFGS